MGDLQGSAAVINGPFTYGRFSFVVLAGRFGCKIISLINKSIFLLALTIGIMKFELPDPISFRTNRSKLIFNSISYK